jgi:hypothetical protein
MRPRSFIKNKLAGIRRIARAGIPIPEIAQIDLWRVVMVLEARTRRQESEIKRMSKRLRDLEDDGQ